MCLALWHQPMWIWALEAALSRTHTADSCTPLSLLCPGVGLGLALSSPPCKVALRTEPDTCAWPVSAHAGTPRASIPKEMPVMTLAVWGSEPHKTPNVESPEVGGQRESRGHRGRLPLGPLSHLHWDKGPETAAGPLIPCMTDMGDGGPAAASLDHGSLGCSPCCSCPGQAPSLNLHWLHLSGPHLRLRPAAVPAWSSLPSSLSSSLL